MRIANSTAPRAARYSAPCGSRETRTAPRAVRIPDYSAPCCSQVHFEAVRTAPRADLKRVTRRSRFFPLVLCSSALASGPLIHPLQASPHHRAKVHGAHPCARCTGCAPCTSARCCCGRRMEQVLPREDAGGQSAATSVTARLLRPKWGTRATTTGCLGCLYRPQCGGISFRQAA